jgi:hypothetical protein
MFLFFTAARIILFGYTLTELEEGHDVLMRHAFGRLTKPLPPGIDPALILLGNERADLPMKRADGTISLIGMLDALIRAQAFPKYHHGMCQFWNDPYKSIFRVQRVLYRRLLDAITTPDPLAVSERLGGALHTLQDTYTLGHTERENNADLYSPLVRVHYSPSKTHPFISPRDRVWVDEAKSQLTPEAETAIQATLAALDLWLELWGSPREQAAPFVAQFVEQYAPIRNHPFAG